MTVLAIPPVLGLGSHHGGRIAQLVTSRISNLCLAGLIAGRCSGRGL